MNLQTLWAQPILQCCLPSPLSFHRHRSGPGEEEFFPLLPTSLWCPISPAQPPVPEEHWSSVTQIEFSKGCIFLLGGEQSPGPCNDTGPTCVIVTMTLTQRHLILWCEVHQWNAAPWGLFQRVPEMPFD